MIEPRRLIDNMNRIGVNFLVYEGNSVSTDPLKPAELLAGLATQSDARMRLALIAVLLQRPDFAKDAPEALAIMDKSQRHTFKIYYTAAHYLQKVYTKQLQDVLGPYSGLPDYYSGELIINEDDSPIDQLEQLAERHEEITGLSLNWFGTYNFAAQRIITRLKKEQEWAKA